MGNELSVAVPSLIQPVESYVSELGSSYHFLQSLGSTRFLKVAKALKRENDLTEGEVVVKVLAVHDPSFSLRPYKDQLESMRERLLQASTGSPNCAPFHHILVSDKAGLMVREFGRWTLEERLSTRPFLRDVEKRWLAFQLLRGLGQAHSVGVAHGDLKSRNLLVSSANWLRLADFAPFKPAFLPIDNPSDFTYFFDTSRKGHCALAPERFCKASKLPSSHSLLAQPSSASFLTAAMDVFGAACVLVEIFCEGTVAFRLGELLRYKEGRSSHRGGTREAHLNAILAPIADDAQLVRLIKEMMSVEPKTRPSTVELLERYRGSVFPESFYTFHYPFHVQFATTPIMSLESRIQLLDEESEKLLGMVGKEDGTGILILPLLTSTMRSLRGVKGRMCALKLLVEFGMRFSVDVVLDRILPYVLSLVSDPVSRVRAEALRSVRALLGTLKSVPESDRRLFPDYVLPKLGPLVHDPAPLVRVALATNLPDISQTALRFLESARASPQDPDVVGGKIEDTETNKKREMARLADLIQEMVVSLLCDSENAVRQALVHNGLPELCVFLGKGRASDLLLSHMITFLNDKRDWSLRASFFRCAPAVAAFIGWQATLILKPLIQQGLRDVEEAVVEAALASLASLAQLQLLQKPAIYELAGDAALFLAHPNPWLRAAAAAFIAALSKRLSMADVHCKLSPTLSRYLAKPLIRLSSPALLLRSLRPPIPRAVWDLVVQSAKMEDLLDFLTQKHFLRQLSPPPGSKGGGFGDFLGGEEERMFSSSPGRERTSSHEKGPEGELGFLYRKLRNLGLEEEMETRLYPFAQTLLKMQKMRSSLAAEQPSSPVEGSVPGCVDLGYLRVTRRHADLTFSLRHKSPTAFPSAQSTPLHVSQTEATVNEEWEAMFGVKRVTTPELGWEEAPTVADPKQPPPLPSTEEDEDEEDELAREISSAMAELETGEAEAEPTVEVPVREPTPPPPVVDTSGAMDRVLVRSECGEGLTELVEWRRREWASMPGAYPPPPLAQPSSSFLPTGFLAAHIHEHRAGVTQLFTRADKRMFGSCSMDGTVKLWDCSKFEGRSQINRSKVTYSGLGNRVRSGGFLGVGERLFCCADNCKTHILRTERLVSKASSPAAKVPGLDGGWLELELQTDPVSEGRLVRLAGWGENGLLGLAHHGQILAWDLRVGAAVVWRARNESRDGLVTAFATDPVKNHWLAVGTHSAHIITWDLRFQLAVSRVRHPASEGGGGVVGLWASESGSSESVWVAVAGNEEVSLWELETGARSLALWPAQTAPLSYQQRSGLATTALLARGHRLITGNSEGAIRAWDTHSPQDSRPISLPREPERPAFQPPGAKGLRSYRSHVVEGVEVVLETEAGKAPSSVPASAAPPVEVEVSAWHKDGVADLCWAYSGEQWFLVSAARDGVIKVWK